VFWNENINPAVEPLKVLLKRGEFTDAYRDGRVIPFKIYFPVEHDLQKIPVVVWSHGFGGNRDGAGFLSRYVASHGYIVVHVTHFGTDSSLWEGKKGHPWDILKDMKIPRQASLDRFKDVPFVLDCLPDWFAENPDVGTPDLDCIGMSGHSFGALTAQVMAGQLIPDQNDVLIAMKEDRFRAAIFYSPMPIRHMTDAPDKKVYGLITLPALHMTGTDDSSPIEGFDYERRLLVFDNAGPADKYLLVKQGGDHMVYNGTRGKLDKNPKRARHEELVKVISLAFWEAYLKDDKKAQAWLSEGGAASYIGQDGDWKAELI
jgi:dienelactone hydrolase